MRCFKNVLKQVPLINYYEIKPAEDISIEDQMELILSKIILKKRLGFYELFGGMQNKTEIIITFLALLELVRHQKIVLYQPVYFGQIIICLIKEGILLKKNVSYFKKD